MRARRYSSPAMRMRMRVGLGGALVLLALLSARAEALVGGPSPGAVTSQTAKIPDGPGSIKGLADSSEVGLFTGQVAYDLALELPKGRGGSAPSVSLGYSGELGNGPLGLGWRLGVPRIIRSLRWGVPNYSEVGELELEGLGAGGRLYADPRTPGRLWVEARGLSLRVDALGTGFVITDSSGTRYFFGSDFASQERSDSSVPERISAWHLRRVVPLVGESVEYTYLRRDGRLYLREVKWGPLVSGEAAFKLDVALEDRPDVTVSWATGFEMRASLRVRSMTVWSFGEVLRTYHVSYEDDDAMQRTTSPRSLWRVTKVSVSGRQGRDALPPLTLGYAKGPTASVKALAGLDGWTLEERGVHLFDVDGDGMADLYRSELGGHLWRRNRGGTFESPRRLAGAEHTDLAGVRFMDLDGDARPELVTIVDDTWRTYRLVEDPAGAGTTFRWEFWRIWPASEGVPLHGPGVEFADVNGDGRTDVIEGATGGLRIRLGRASGLAPLVRLPAVSARDAEVEPGHPNVRFIDANGDGLVDVLYLTDSYCRTWLGRGDGTFSAYARVPWPWKGGAFDVDDLRVADLDRDGLVDLVRFTAGHVVWYPGTTSGGFDETRARFIVRPVGAAADSVVTIADVNGSGSSDLVWSEPRGMWALDFAGDTSAAMLESIDNGMGKRTTFSYRSSASLCVEDQASGRPWMRRLPVSIPVPVLTEVAFAAGGPSRKIRYSVADGAWDGEERRFGGFSIGRRIVPGDVPASDLEEETQFHAGVGDERVLRGQILSVLRKDGLGQRLVLDRNQIEARMVAGLPSHRLARLPATTATVSQNFEGVVVPIETRTELEYDAEVRVSKEHHFGRTDRLGDEKEVRRTHASDPMTWVRDRVCEESVYAADPAMPRMEGKVVARSRFTYGDNLAPAAAAPGEACGVGKGWLLETHGYLDATTGPPASPARWVRLSAKTYDDLGNTLTVEEAGVVRTLGYDARRFFPESESVTPAAGKTLTWHLTWDAVLGAPGTLTGPDGNTTELTYDDLGRELRRSVGGHPAHVHYRYDWSAPRPRTTTFVFEGSLQDLATAGVPPGTGWRETVSMANGAGEDLYTATRAAADRWIVTGWKERDLRGQVVRVADPFYLTSSDPILPSLPAGPDVRAQTLRYDALARVQEQTLPNGAKRVMTYKAFEQTATSPLMAPVRSVMDGFGRIVRTERTVSGVKEEVEAAFDAADRVLTMTLQSGKALHSFEYDTLGQLIRAHDPDIGERRMQYDDNGLLLRHRNGAGQALAFFYDTAGRLVARGPRDDFGSPSVSRSYTDAQRALGLGKDFVYNYDAPEATGSTFTNLKSRLAWVTEPAGVAGQPGKVAYSYDVLGRQTFVSRSVGGVAAQEAVELSASGLLLRQRTDDGFDLRPTYDLAGRLVQLREEKQIGGDVWRVGHAAGPDSLNGLDAAGRVLFETYGNGIEQSYTLDDLGLTRGITIRSGAGSKLYDVEVQRNAYGAPKAVTDLLKTVGLDHTATFAYDEGARLVDATLGETAATRWKFRYRYDGLQNMTARFQQGPASRPQGIGILSGYYRYGENGKGPRQLTTLIHKDCPGDQTTFDYDGAGRVTREADKILTYDGYDQLTQVQKPAGTTLVSHAYGFDGLRTFTKAAGIEQRWFSSNYTLRTPQPGTAERWHYVSVGDRLVARLKFANQTSPLAVGVVERFVRDAWPRIPAVVVSATVLMGLVLLLLALWRRRPVVPTAAALGAAVALVVAPLSCGIEDRRFGLELATDRLYFHQGLSAGPFLITGSTGAIKDERRFEPFGQPIDGDLKVDPFNNLNKETNLETGWSYHGARWMAPQTGRWLTPDPPVKAPDPKALKSPWDLHPFQYARHNPTQFWDSNGSFPVYFDAKESFFGVLFEDLATHQRITRDALEKRVSFHVLETVIRANVLEDKLQKPEDQVRHGMRAIGESAKAAAERHGSLIDRRLGQARDLILSGDFDRAWEVFGAATHNVQDPFARAHRANGAPTTFGVRDWVPHLASDMTERAGSPEALRARDATRLLFDRLRQMVVTTRAVDPKKPDANFWLWERAVMHGEH